VGIGKKGLGVSGRSSERRARQERAR